MPRPYATAQHIGSRTHQCDATAVSTAPGGARAYVLLDGIGSSDAVREWTRGAARRLARTAARRGDAEAGLRAVYGAYAAEPARRDPYADRPNAAAVVAVVAPDRPLTVAWCGDSRAYLLDGTDLRRLTADHNLRRVFPPRDGQPGGNRNVITSYLGSPYTEEDTAARYGHPAIEAATAQAGGLRLLLASDGAYEPLEDGGHSLADHLAGDLGPVARGLVRAAVQRGGDHADNATVLVADLPTA